MPSSRPSATPSPGLAAGERVDGTGRTEVGRHSRSPQRHVLLVEKDAGGDVQPDVVEERASLGEHLELANRPPGDARADE